MGSKMPSDSGEAAKVEKQKSDPCKRRAQPEIQAPGFPFKSDKHGVKILFFHVAELMEESPLSFMSVGVHGMI